MKYIIFIFLLISSIGFSQEIDDLLKSREFVLEAHKITDPSGISNTASRRMCFILIDATKIIVQWMGTSDNNGLGGITINGKIDNYTVSTNNLDSETQHLVNIKCALDDGRVQTEINVEIFNKSHAEATIRNQTASIFVPEQMTFLGRLVPLSESKVIIGSD
jgi:hypothetical protein